MKNFLSRAYDLNPMFRKGNAKSDPKNQFHVHRIFDGILAGGINRLSHQILININIMPSSPRNRNSIILCSIVVLLMSCQPADTTITDVSLSYPADVEAISLLGDSLRRPSQDTLTLHKADSMMDIAYTFYLEDSTDLEAIIWYGRRLAYLHRYREAIGLFSKGIKLHPASPELLRHRGHRYITIRQWDAAIADLEKAAVLAANVEMTIEPDGQPNKLDIPLSNLHFNIYYHLGLAYYLKADFKSAIKAFTTALNYSPNPDLEVASRYWLCLVHLQMGNPGEAETIMAPVHPDMEIIENTAYLHQLLVMKGMIDTIPVQDQPAQLATSYYGLSCWYAAKNENAKASALRRQILEEGFWPAFGYIAAEADSVRLMIK